MWKYRLDGLRMEKTFSVAFNHNEHKLKVTLKKKKTFFFFWNLSIMLLILNLLSYILALQGFPYKLKHKSQLYFQFNQN